MPDREKVIRALRNCSVQNDVGCQGCPYFEERKTYGHEWCTTSMAQDSLALLKEQEKQNGKCVNECECWDAAYERGKQDALKEQETVDHALDILRANGWKKEEPICAHCEAIHVVQCRDCKHGWNINPSEDVKFYSCLNPKMVNMHWSHHGDWYCGDGVRRE